LLKNGNLLLFYLKNKKKKSFLWLMVRALLSAHMAKPARPASAPTPARRRASAQTRPTLAVAWMACAVNVGRVAVRWPLRASSRRRARAPTSIPSTNSPSPFYF
jgi:hypothetical protein